MIYSMCMLFLFTSHVIGSGNAREILSPKFDRICEATEYRCNNGDCIDSKFLCDSVVDCQDDSDESLPPCESSFRNSFPETAWHANISVRERRAYGYCIVPPEPENGSRRFHPSTCYGKESCDIFEGASANPGDQLVYSCSPGFKMIGNPNVVCTGAGNWLEIPTCVEVKCRILNSDSKSGVCTYRGKVSNCDRPVLPETRAKLSCRSGYKKDTSSPITHRDEVECNSNGEWVPRPVECNPACGMASNRQIPNVFNGTRARIVDFPWHATLYREILTQTGEAKKDFKCGGTVIHAKVILTAAHCIYDEATRSTLSPDIFYIATGNFYRDYDSPEHDLQVVQRRQVQNIYAYCPYNGLEGNYASDIALLELRQALSFSSLLVPACLDVSGLSRQFFEPGVYGKVAGFGDTGKTTSSAILQTITIPYVPYSTCRSSRLESKDHVYITRDKFCAGWADGRANVCQGDSGGGLVFSIHNLWYVLGIVSVGLGDETTFGEVQCQNFKYTLYTEVSGYTDWISDVLWKVERNEYYSSLCDASCPPMNETSTTMRCFSAGQWTSCSFPVPANTKAKISCRNGFKLSDQNQDITVCKANGKWNPEKVTCVPKEQTSGTCKLSDGRDGVCTLSEICISRVHDLSSDLRVAAGSCSGTRYVCCPVISTDRSGSGGRGWISRQKCVEYTKYRARTRCDVSGPKTETSVATKGKHEEFPFVANFGFSHGEDVAWACGGVLISERFVLGAAKCANFPGWGDADRVRVGALRFEAITDQMQTQERAIIQIIRHPGWKESVYYHDIALFKLESPIRFDKYVFPACLHSAPSIEETQSVTVTGWGVHGPCDSLANLEKVSSDTHIVQQSSCDASYGPDSRQSLPLGIVDELIVCVNESGQDACQVFGSGNPLLIASNDHDCMYDVAGIAVFGRRCGDPTPRGYARVYNYIGWIEKIVWPQL